MFRYVFLLCCLLIKPVIAQTPDAKFVTIEGIQLEYLDIGTGKNTLVVESGVGMGLAYWQPLLADFARLNIRTVIYSRAGNGKSQSATDISLAASSVRLEKLLQAIQAKNNLFLLGHSFGALHVRAFAAAHPDRVKGLLLLDPSHERFDSELVQLNSAWAQRDRIQLNKLMKGQPEWHYLQNIYLQKNIPDKDIANKIPAVLVTSSKLNESDWWIGHSPEGKQIWRDLHLSLIRSNKNAIHIVTDQTGHNIPLENKALLFHAIRTLLVLHADHGAVAI